MAIITNLVSAIGIGGTGGATGAAAGAVLRIGVLAAGFYIAVIIPGAYTAPVVINASDDTTTHPRRTTGIELAALVLTVGIIGAVPGISGTVVGAGHTGARSGKADSPVAGAVAIVITAAVAIISGGTGRSPAGASIRTVRIPGTRLPASPADTGHALTALHRAVGISRTRHAGPAQNTLAAGTTFTLTLRGLATPGSPSVGSAGAAGGTTSQAIIAVLATLAAPVQNRATGIQTGAVLTLHTHVATTADVDTATLSGSFIPAIGVGIAITSQ